MDEIKSGLTAFSHVSFLFADYSGHYGIVFQEQLNEYQDKGPSFGMTITYYYSSDTFTLWECIALINSFANGFQPL